MGNSRGAALVSKCIYIVLGNLCYAMALNLFLVDNNIAAGGFSGLAIAINRFFPVPVGTFVLVLTVPLLVWAIFAKGWSFTLATLATTGLYTLMVDGTAPFVPCATHDPLLAAICGGALTGTSAVLFLRADSSSGGTDLLARLLLTRRRDLSLGTMFMVVDGAVVLFSMLVNRNLEIGIYAVISITVASWVNDRLIRGMNRASLFFIITSGPPEAVAEAVMTRLPRGVTLLRGEGMYARQERNVLMTVVRPGQVHRVKALIKSIDPDACVFTAAINEVVGKGFRDVDASATRADRQQAKGNGQ